MQNLFKKKFMKVPHLSFLNAFREIGRNAFVDWIFILLISILIAILLIMSGWYLYWQISTGNFSSTIQTETMQQKNFNKKDLSTVLNIFQSKQEMSSQLLRGYRGPSDPSN